MLDGTHGYTADYWQTLVNDFAIPAVLARYLARKYGTTSPEVLVLTPHQSWQSSSAANLAGAERKKSTRLPFRDRASTV